MSYDEVRILIVDDDEISVMSIKRAIKKINILNPIRVAKDGVQALEILRGESSETQMLQPYIIFLDINMPRMDGHEFLAHLRDDVELKRALVFVLTTSDAPEDVRRAYDKNVAGYVVKEDTYETFKSAFEMVNHFSNLIVFPD